MLKVLSAILLLSIASSQTFDTSSLRSLLSFPSPSSLTKITPTLDPTSPTSPTTVSISTIQPPNTPPQNTNKDDISTTTFVSWNSTLTTPFNDPFNNFFNSPPRTSNVFSTTTNTQSLSDLQTKLANADVELNQLTRRYQSMMITGDWKEQNEKLALYKKLIDYIRNQKVNLNEKIRNVNDGMRQIDNTRRVVYRTPKPIGNPFSWKNMFSGVPDNSQFFSNGFNPFPGPWGGSFNSMYMNGN